MTAPTYIEEFVYTIATTMNTTSSLPPSFTLPPDELQPLKNLRIFYYIQVVSVALLVFDTIITIPEEVEFIWRRKFNLSSYIFLVNRYLPYADGSLLLFNLFSPDPSSLACSITFPTKVGLLSLGIWIAEFVLVLRTYAIWENKKAIAFILLAYLLITLGISTYLLYLNMKNIGYIHSPSPSAFPGCFLTGGTTNQGISFIFVVIFETAVSALTLYRVYSRGLSSGVLLNRIVKNGVLVYLYLLTSSIVNITILYTSSPELESGLFAVHRVLHALLTSRLLLHIRSSASRSSQPSLDSLSTFEVRPGDIQLVELPDFSSP